jgi:hypothetical protein
MGLVNKQDENRARWPQVLLGAALGLVVGLIIAALVWTNVLSFGVTWWPVVFAVTTCSGALGGWLFHWKNAHTPTAFPMRPTAGNPAVQASGLGNNSSSGNNFCWRDVNRDNETFEDVPLGEGGRPVGIGDSCVDKGHTSSV